MVAFCRITTKGFLLRFFLFFVCFMENKAPGTEPRPGGYASSTGATENFFHPRPNMKKKSLQRSGLRGAKKLMYCCAAGVLLFIVAPTHLGPLYVNYVAKSEWLKRAEEAAASIWTRRNAKDFHSYMTQRKNSFYELMGLKRYNIGGEENDGDIQKYR